MKTLDHANSTFARTAASPPSVKICMHVRGVARTDRRVLHEAIALLEGGFSVSIVDVESALTDSVEEDISGIRVKHILKSHWYTPTRGLWRIVRSAEKFIYSTWILLQMSADIYHAHDVDALPPCFIAAMLRRKPLVFDAHELPLDRLDRTHWHRLHKLLELFLAGMVSRCSGVVTVSSPIAEEIRNHYSAQGVTLLRNIPPFQKVPRSDRLRQYLGLGPDVRIALYQGNICPARSLDRLVRSAAFLEAGIVVVLMGKGVGETPAELEALAIKEGVADRVKIIPPVPYSELLEWTASADIGLCVFSPDYSLGIRWCLPNKLFEYLMAGLPALASPLDAVEDILKTYDVGRIVSSLAPADVGAAINMMLADQVAFARMQRNALEAVQKDLNWEKESQQLSHLYRTILRQSFRV